MNDLAELERSGHVIEDPELQEDVRTLFGLGEY